MSVPGETARRPRIGLYGPFGWGNLGDAAIQEAMMANIRARIPTAEIVGFSLNPEDTREIHGIEAVPIRRGKTGLRTERSPRPPDRAPPRQGRRWTRSLRRVIREVRFLVAARRLLKQFEVLVISGGGQLSDFWGGPLYHPYTLAKWTAAARLAGARVYMVSLGAGPIRSRGSSALIRLALHLAHYRSYRDVESHTFLAARFRLTRPDPVYPDLAFSLPSETGRSRSGPPERPVIGISPLSYCHPEKGPWPTQDQSKYEAYLATLLDFTSERLEQGHPVQMFSSQIRNDLPAFDDLVEALRGRGWTADGDLLEASPTGDLGHLLEQISHSDVVVTSRLHGVILSYLLHKPVLALTYHPKIDAVMRQFGQTQYCVDIDTAEPAVLRERFDSLLSNLSTAREQIRARASQHRDRLRAQYDHLFGPASPGR